MPPTFAWLRRRKRKGNIIPKRFDIAFSLFFRNYILEPYSFFDQNKANDTLIYQPKFDIVNILKYFLKTPLHAFERIALDEATAKDLQGILRNYMSYHLDIGTLKSESFLKEIF